MPSCLSQRQLSLIVFEDTDVRGVMKLYCSILVDRASQKRIVIGHGGSLIKQIGIEAREEIEKFFATKVYLDLHVKIKSGWRENEKILGELGLSGRVLR